LRTALRDLALEKPTVVPERGFSQTARWADRAKLHALATGARLVRRELMGQTG
jgi:5-methyltetrahydropteroyltriglutamate--homocysteine methyltransferase